jgi:hypothetical protein
MQATHRGLQQGEVNTKARLPRQPVGHAANSFTNKCEEQEAPNAREKDVIPRGSFDAVEYELEYERLCGTDGREHQGQRADGENCLAVGRGELKRAP